MSKTPGLFLFVLSISHAAGQADTATAATGPPDMRACHGHRPYTDSPRVHASNDSLIVQQNITKLRFHIDTPAGIVRDDTDAFNGSVAHKAPFAQANLATIELHADAGRTDHRLIGMMWSSQCFPVVRNLPSMHFVGRGVEWLDDTSAVLRGYMTIGNTTRHVEFEVSLVYSRADETRKDRIGLKARTILRRSEFGMGALVPLVRDDVKLCLRFEAARDRPRLSLVTST